MTDLATLDPLEPVLPPAGVRASRLVEVSAAVAAAASGRVDVAGLRGCASAAVSAAVANAGRRIVVVANDADGARRLAEDLAYFTKEDVLVLADDETSPYADVNPDRRAAMSRMATLVHLAHARAAARARRRRRRRSRARSSRGRSCARTRIASSRRTSSIATGSSRASPRPATCACRSSRIRARSRCAARCSTCGRRARTSRCASSSTATSSCRSSRSTRCEQKTRKDARRAGAVALAPAREAILARENVTRARDRVAQLADVIDWPTIEGARARRRRGERPRVLRRRGVPARVLRRARVALRVPARRRGRRARRSAGDHARAPRRARRARRRGRRRARRQRTPHFLVDDVLRDEDEVAARSRRRAASSRCTARRSWATAATGLDAYEVARGRRSISRRAITRISRAR